MAAKKTKKEQKPLPYYKDPAYLNWTEQPQNTLICELMQDCKDTAGDYGYDTEPSLDPSDLDGFQASIREIRDTIKGNAKIPALGKATMVALGIDGDIDDPVDYASIQYEIGLTVDNTLELGSIVLTEEELSPWQRKDFPYKDKVWVTVRRPQFHTGLPHKHPELILPEDAEKPLDLT